MAIRHYIDTIPLNKIPAVIRHLRAYYPASEFYSYPADMRNNNWHALMVQFDINEVDEVHAAVALEKVKMFVYGFDKGSNWGEHKVTSFS